MPFFLFYKSSRLFYFHLLLITIYKHDLEKSRAFVKPSEGFRTALKENSCEQCGVIFIKIYNIFPLQ